MSGNDEFKIGRGRPPREHRFKKGSSGNPRGRPKGSKNLKTYVTKAAREKVSVRQNGKSKRIPKIEATIAQLSNKAASGDPRSMEQFINRVEKVEMDTAAERPAAYPLSELDREVINEMYRRMKLCEV
jgi:hypothetical protein